MLTERGAGVRLYSTTSRSHIVFASFQDAPFSFLVSNLFGCNLVGDAFAGGYWSLPVDPKQAAKWYRKMQACELETLKDESKEEAAAWLREHATD